MNNKEVIEKIKGICDSYAVENDCPFFDNEHNDCIFYLNGLDNPSKWRADNER